MKKFLAFALSVTMLLGLTACGGDKEKDPENSTEVQEEITSLPEESTAAETATPTPTPTPTQTPAYRLQGTYGFNNGYALIRFYDEANRTYCAGFINEKGKLQNYVVSNSLDDYQSKSGYMYLNEQNALVIVTPKGKATALPLGDNVYRKAAGDGFTVIQEYKSGFDAVEYVYHIYNEEGKEVNSYSSGKDQCNVYYAGDKTFIFAHNDWSEDLYAYGGGAYYADVYFGENNSWLKDQVVTSTGYTFSAYTYQDGLLMLQGNSRGGGKNVHSGEFVYTDNKGSLTTITAPETLGNSPVYLGCSDGVVFFWGYANNQYTFCGYDTASKSWSDIYQGSYADKIVNTTPVVGDGKVAMVLRGADGKNYTMTLDKNMKEQLDAPVLGSPAKLYDGKTCVMESSTLHVYDRKGKDTAQIERYDTYANQMTDNGLVVGGQYQYFTLNGKEAFQVDFSSGKEVKLPTQG